MAKENKIHPGLLFMISSALLTAGWMMKPFPVLLFVAYAPLFAITDSNRDKDHFWNLSELILGSLLLGLLASHGFSMSSLVISLIQAIILTFAFLGYSFTHQRLGKWSGKVMIVVFWLGLEFVMLKLPWRENFVYLADAMSLQPKWFRWTTHTGYLGVSFWILLTNILFYQAAFRGNIKWPWVMLTLFTIAAPIAYSVWLGQKTMVTRTDMILRYQHQISGLSPNYIRLGEVISGAAAVVAACMLIVAYFNNQATRK